MDEMNTNAVSPVPYIAFEAAQARAERITKRLVFALVIAIALIFASNAVWLWAWMQYDYVSETVTTETVTVDGSDGAANYASNGGSYRGSYARGRGRNARRDSMGRYSNNGGYSRDGDLVDQLNALMQDAPNETIKREMQRLAEKIEQQM